MPNYPEPQPRLDFFFGRPVVSHAALDTTTPAPKFHLDRSAVIGKCMSACVCYQFSYDHAQPPALRRAQLQWLLDEHQVNSLVLQSRSTDRPAEVPKVLRCVDGTIYRGHL